MMESRERARAYLEEIGNLPQSTLRTFDTPERDQYWSWLSSMFDLGGLDSYLEVGCNCGCSMWMTAPFVRAGCRIVGVDLGNGKSGQPQARNRVAQAVGAHIINGRSAEVAPQVAPFGPFHLALIDADHSYEGVYSDWMAYRGMIRPGGYVVFHDTRAQSMGVYRLWSEIKTAFAQTWELGNRQGIGIGRMQE